MQTEAALVIEEIVDATRHRRVTQSGKGPGVITGNGGWISTGKGRNGRAMNSIISEKRYVFVGLPLLLATLALFYVLAAAALFAEAANFHSSIAKHGRSETVVLPAVIQVRG